MLGKPRILSLFPTRLINSIKHEHSCKILYLFNFLIILDIHLGHIAVLANQVYRNHQDSLQTSYHRLYHLNIGHMVYTDHHRTHQSKLDNKKDEFIQYFCIFSFTFCIFSCFIHVYKHSFEIYLSFPRLPSTSVSLNIPMLEFLDFSHMLIE